MIPNPPPTASTLVDPARPNLMGRYKSVAKVLGIDKFHDWQEHWLTGASELNDDGTRRRRRCGLMVGRQGGKSELIPTVAFEAALSGLHVGYTAQERSRAHEKWREWCERWMDYAPPKWRGTMRLEKGQEKWSLRKRGSFRLLSPNGKSPRGPTLDAIVCDESAWVKPEFLDAAMGTLSTRPGWVVYEFCTAPDERKNICQGFMDTRDTGLKSLLPDAPPELDEVFWVEYAGDESTDLRDEREWERLIPTLDVDDPPGVQRSLIRSEYNKHAKRGTLDVFGREYLCIPSKPAAEIQFDFEAWAACAAEVKTPMGAVIGVDVSPDREHAAIAAAYANSPTDVVVEVVRAIGGCEWVPRELDKLRDKHPNWINRVVLDEMPCGGIATELRHRGFFVEQIDHRAYGRYYGALVDLVRRKELRQRPHPALDAAVQSAGVRKLGEGSAWNRRGDDPICALVAATLAVGAAQEMPAPNQLVM